VGSWVDKYPDSVKALAEAGHEVCNHSDTHPHMPKLSESDMKKQIESCNEKIKAITGVSPILFRPPYGDYNNAVVKTAQDLGMYAIQWDVDSLDWKNPTPQQIIDRVTKKVKPGFYCSISQRSKEHARRFANHFENTAIRRVHHCAGFSVDCQGQLHNRFRRHANSK
jgi:peptidoglycan/xylan/chitin deacetylase (PgdA/CDA1 family)